MGKYRFVKRVIRSLKRQHGQPIVLYKTTAAATIDYTQGTASGRTTDNKPIAKAIILPGRTTTGFNYDLTFIAANKNFTYGGTYDATQRDVIIDRADIGTFDIDMQTRIRFNESDYTIKELNDFEEANAVYIVMVKTEGQVNE